MKSFKDYGSLSEGSFKEGSAMEGMFAIAVALYLRDGKMPSVAMVEAKRKKIRLPMKRPTRYGPVWDQIGKQPKDRFTIYLNISLNTEEMKTKKGKYVFSPDGSPVYTKIGDIPTLDEKVATMLRGLKSTDAISQIDKFVNKLLKNKTPDEVILRVRAEGVEGGSAGDNIKGDVNVIIEAEYGKSKGNKKQRGKKKDIITIPLAFSLKSDSHTFSNNGAWKSIKNLAIQFGLPVFNEKNIAKLPASATNWKGYSGEALLNILSSRVEGGDQKKIHEKRIANAKMFDLLIDKFVAENRSSNDIKKSSYNLIDNAVFGSDKANVLDLKGKEIIEVLRDTILTYANDPMYDSYKYSLSYTYAVDESGNDLVGTIGGGVGGIQIDVTYEDENGKKVTNELLTVRAKMLLNYSSKDGHAKAEIKVLVEGGDFFKNYGGKTLAPVPASSVAPKETAKAISRLAISTSLNDPKSTDKDKVIVQRVNLDKWIMDDDKNLRATALEIITSRKKTLAAKLAGGKSPIDIYSGSGNLKRATMNKIEKEIKRILDEKKSKKKK